MTAVPRNNRRDVDPHVVGFLQAPSSTSSDISNSEKRRDPQRNGGAHMELSPLPSLSVCSPFVTKPSRYVDDQVCRLPLLTHVTHTVHAG